MARRFDIPLDPDLEMAGILEDLGRAKDLDSSTPTSASFASALCGLIALEPARSAGTVASPENTSRFREAMSAALVEQNGNFWAFCGRTSSAEENSASGARHVWAVL